MKWFLCFCFFFPFSTEIFSEVGKKSYLTQEKVFIRSKKWTQLLKAYPHESSLFQRALYGKKIYFSGFLVQKTFHPVHKRAFWTVSPGFSVLFPHRYLFQMQPSSNQVQPKNRDFVVLQAKVGKELTAFYNAIPLSYSKKDFYESSKADELKLEMEILRLRMQQRRKQLKNNEVVTVSLPNPTKISTLAKRSLPFVPYFAKHSKENFQIVMNWKRKMEQTVSFAEQMAYFAMAQKITNLDQIYGQSNVSDDQNIVSISSIALHVLTSFFNVDVNRIVQEITQQRKKQLLSSCRHLLGVQILLFSCVGLHYVPIPSTKWDVTILQGYIQTMTLLLCQRKELQP